MSLPGKKRNADIVIDANQSSIKSFFKTKKVTKLVNESAPIVIDSD